MGAAALWAAPASAAVVVKEDFNYGATAGSLAGQNGGTGFSTAWNGGTYTPTATTAVLPPENGISNSPDPNLRSYENDNVSNFHNGRLN